MAVPLTRREIEEKFKRVFTSPQAESLTEVLDNLRELEVQRVADTRDLKQGLTNLSAEVAKLAEAQRHTDERLAEFEQRTDQRFAELAEAQARTDESVRRLAEAQARTDESVRRLAEAQARTDERLGRLEIAVGKLAEAQARTDESVRRLAEAQARTDERLDRLEIAVGKLAEAQARTDESVRRLAEAQERTDRSLGRLEVAVGGLANAFGFRLEEFVAALLPPYLEKHYGIRTTSLERRYFDLGGGCFEEVDLAGEGQRNGETLLLLVECRSTIGGSEVRRLAEKLSAVSSALTPMTTVSVVVAMNVHPTAVQAAEETGIIVVPYSRIGRLWEQN